MTNTATLAHTPIHACPADCREATSHRATCTCRCGGANHGDAHRVGIARATADLRRRATAAGGTFEYLRRSGGLFVAPEPF